MAITNGDIVEIKDNSGSTVAYSGTATTTITNVPPIADKQIAQVMVTTDTTGLQVSFDSGATYITLNKNDVLSWEVKGTPTQLKIKTASGSAVYKALINFEVI